MRGPRELTKTLNQRDASHKILEGVVTLKYLGWATYSSDILFKFSAYNIRAKGT